mgnify:CR=1 FL=1
MSSYFDSLNAELRQLFEQGKVPPLFWSSHYEPLEDRVVRTCSLVTGDREFPDDLREKIQGESRRVLNDVRSVKCLSKVIRSFQYGRIHTAARTRDRSR